MSRVLALRHHYEDSPGLVGEAFEARGYEVDLVMMDETSATPSLEGYDAMFILGSKCAVYDQEVEAAWFHRELALIGEAETRSLPILGICFGAQALCRYYGGDVRRAVDGEIGWFEIDVVDGVDLPRGPWFEFHFDHCTLPASAELWATSPRAVQAFAIGPNVGVQFHPEIDDGQLKEWLAADEDETRDLGLDVATLLAATARETPAARVRAQELVDLFLRRVG
ncbi:MAG TPA: type 1 glutamine amidotransferase [Acidimicrobiales bacterium]|jgi:GMP synthase-like glutamine amidotransferase|nr:type 1 glutamine amidotransferase [Acidimicrobiales bacterium]